MDVRQYMIVYLEKRGDKRMFVTEQVASINENKNGLWTVKFMSSPRVFNYNQSRLLFLTRPETIDLGEKGLYIKNKHYYECGRTTHKMDEEIATIEAKKAKYKA